MKFKVGLLVLLTTTLRCEGHLSILGGLLSTAHEHIHSKVQDVAGTILGGIDKGLNFNFESHVEVNRQRQQGYPNSHNYPNNNEYNNQNNFNEPNLGNEPVNGNPPNNEYDVTQGQTYPNIVSTTSQRPELSTSTTLYTTEVKKSYKDDKATQKPTDDDVPLFIPLGPNDYVYNGDKINVTDPKMHAEKKPQPAKEENFPIDIRFKDE